MSEHLSLNGNSLNQLCKRLLQQAKADYLPDSLYSLQLVHLTLQNHPNQVPFPAQQFRKELESEALEMMSHNPKQVLRMLTSSPDRPLVRACNLQADQIRSLSPWKAGASLAQTLWQNLQETRQQFQIPEPLIPGA